MCHNQIMNHVTVELENEPYWCVNALYCYNTDHSASNDANPITEPLVNTPYYEVTLPDVEYGTLTKTIYDIMIGLGYNIYHYTIITAGTIIPDIIKVVDILRREGFYGKIITIVNIRKLDGISKIIPYMTPIFFISDGSVQILSSMVCRALLLENFTLFRIYEGQTSLTIDPVEVAKFISITV